ncbi:methylated-DNA--[protein]-cysteine S-methyltransferase [Nesterenkonia flava]|uniref:Methylated-DNA--[protein]-cysteine S-methyltransferase n=1 Tax=Nesterenkonia flava TaxID=469799 RepID=A0ABU1FU54_9MICC|nr:methylated-DNA--[protein]-cysteine S-methyltransferase [Nesterenkonia flava]MDR5712197.1 methylated-DNA--[protein]-cysteine S-methyltransferase [Nesterenkonia flava]
MDIHAGYATLSTPDGPLTIIADDDAVLASGWTDDTEALVSRTHPRLRPALLEPGAGAALEQAVAAAEAYYRGDLAAIDQVPVRQISGPYRIRAWEVLRTVAPGHPVTYAQFADLTGNPAAVRAAASVCASNAAALFVPCHRVIRTDGGLGGFAFGTQIKRSLLAREAEAGRAADR